MRHLVDQLVLDVRQLTNGDASKIESISNVLTDINKHLGWGWSLTTFEQNHLADAEMDIAKWICSNSSNVNISTLMLREKLWKMDNLLKNPSKMKPFNYYWNSIKHS